MPRKIKRQNRLPNPVLHIFCEGEKTEPHYLQHYKDLFCKGKTSIKIEKTEKTTPVQLVQEAIDMKKSVPRGVKDEFWVVYDRESPAKYSEALHQKARDKANAHGINIAISNVCFEVWLLLHKRPGCPACNSCDELTRRQEFKTFFPGYSKGAACNLTREEIQSARENAVRMNKATIASADNGADAPSKLNPYTAVPHLLYAIDSF